MDASLTTDPLGPVYTPAAGVRWAIQASQRGRDDDVQAAVLAASLGGLAALALLAALTSPEPLRPSGSHGTAEWGGTEALEEAERGIVLGRASAKKKPLLRYDGPGHALTVAPTRAGKGVGAVVPNLLDHPGPVLVTDPKGENLVLTARYRAGVLGHRVIALDPFGLAPASLFGRVGEGSVERGALNPLDLLRPGSTDASDDAAGIAEMLVVDDDGGNRFWNDEARALLGGLVLHVALAETGARRSLLTVREHLTAAPDDFEAVLAAMAGSSNSVVQRTANRIRQKHDKERSAVVSTAQSHTHFLDSPRMAGVLGHSTFSLEALRGGRAGGSGRLSVYLLLPPDRLDAFSRWLRLMVATALAEVARLGPLPGGAPPEGGRALFLLDEFAQLGPMAPVRRAVSLMAGYGVQVWTFLQDLGQLRRLYPKDWESFVANADVVQAFGVTDQFTAEYLSKMAGTATVFDRSTGSGRSRGKQTSRSTNVGSRETARALVTPDELRRLGTGEQLLVVRGSQPVRARRVAFYADAVFKPRADSSG